MTQPRRFVIDASAQLALVHAEPGADIVEALIPGALMSAVNWAEVVQKAVERDIDVDALRNNVRDLGLDIVPFTPADAELAATLWSETQNRGISLADRACLALAVTEQATAVTADRAWRTLPIDIAVELIR